MELALMRHQVRGEGTGGGAIHHQPEVLRPHMLAAGLEAVGHRCGEANRVAAQAFFDAFAGHFGKLVHRANSGRGLPNERWAFRSVPASASLGKVREFR